ncbi:1614_t:CDS:2 [Funneliformis geosporum]|uniref:1614_t:CDS:1 n=1 Tax=Funneliformis geosporum TaxID=1117311 RepID=A0A9W4SY40_9GLOM|nr:1614_t:CDS:2 [Funneliformis geosporum]
MESHWNTYFEETRSGDYRFIGCYHYRLQQDDFSFSFQKEFNRLKKKLDNIVKNGSDEMRNSAKQLINSFKENGTHTTTVASYVHREYFMDVDAIWRKIELHEELQHIEEEASRSIMYDTKKVINTTIENACSTIRNINNRLVNLRKRAKNQPDSEDIKRVNAIIDDERAIDEYEEFNTEKAEEVDSSNYFEEAKTFNVSFDEYIDSTVNIQDESEIAESSVEDEEIKFDLNDI